MELTALPPDIPVDLGDIDLYDPTTFTRADQHPTWRTLRVKAPVWWHDRAGGTGFWCVTRYADCERVVKDYRTFSSQEGTILASVGVGDTAGGQTITLTDPPEHAARMGRPGPQLRTHLPWSITLGSIPGESKSIRQAGVRY